VVSDLVSQKRLGVFDDHLAETGPNTEVWAVAVNTNGTKALSGTNGGEIRYWDVATLQSSAQVPSDGEPVASLAFFPGDETKVLSGHGNGKMILWNYTPNGLQQGPTFDHLNAITVNSIAVCDNNGPKAMTASFDGHLRLWDLNNPNLPPTVLPIEHTHFVWRVTVAPDGKTFASAGEDHKVEVFRLNGDRALNPPITEADGVMGVAFVSNTRVVYTTGSLADPQVKYADFPAAP
jgi:WD40 repeat protein